MGAHFSSGRPLFHIRFWLAFHPLLLIPSFLRALLHFCCFVFLFYFLLEGKRRRCAAGLCDGAHHLQDPKRMKHHLSRLMTARLAL